ncbi:MAG: TIGR01777 family oxidoreductase [Planctomycetaceae bacterium]
MSGSTSTDPQTAAVSSGLTTVAITGASGMVGGELSKNLASEGRKVVAITRGESGAYEDSIRWDPNSGLINPGRLESVDAVVHLAGENIAGGRWNEKRKAKIRNSRVQGTRSLVQSIAAVQQRPKVLVCASAIGYYGDRGDEKLTESSDAGSGFLADVCRQWETEAMAAEKLDVRVVCVRIGVVLSPRGGALAKMLLPFRLGVGGVVGSGRQYMSWIGLADLARAVTYCVDNDSIAGPVNAVTPGAVTNGEFTRTLGKVLHRPTVFPLPGFAARLVLGEMADELLLASTRVIPERLQRSGFQFDHGDLEECLRFELDRR